MLAQSAHSRRGKIAGPRAPFVLAVVVEGQPRLRGRRRPPGPSAAPLTATRDCHLPLPPVIKAVLWMAVTLLSFTTMAVAVREVSDTISPFQVMFFRSLVAAIILVPFVIHFGWRAVATQRPRLHLVRNIVHLGGQLGWVYGVFLLPLAHVFALEFTTPIWTALLATLFLGERMNRGRTMAIVAGFVGIVIILRPGFETISIGALVVLGAAIGFAGALTTTKELTKTDGPLAIMTIMTIVQFPIVTTMAATDWTTPLMSQLPWLFAIGAVSLLAHYCLTRAFMHADATIVAPMDFMRLPLIAIVGFSVYAEPFDLPVLAGALLIFAGNYYSIYREHRAAQLAHA